MKIWCTLSGLTPKSLSLSCVPSPQSIRNWCFWVPRIWAVWWRPYAGVAEFAPNILSSKDNDYSSSPSSFSTSCMKTASTASSTVGRMFRTLSSWEILISLVVWSDRLASTKMPPSSCTILFPTNKALRPEESVYFTSERSRMMLLMPSAWILISSDLRLGAMLESNFS